MFSRRQFGQLAGAVGLRAWLGGGASGCQQELEAGVDDDTQVGEGVVGGATFEVTESGALLSVHARGHSQVVVRVRGPGIATGEVRHDLALAPDQGETGVLELDGLVPGGGYEYFIEVPGVVAGPYRFHTAPNRDEPRDLRLLIASDIDVRVSGRSPILQTMAGHEADFAVSLGDFPYCDGIPSAHTAEEFRAKHQSARLDANVQRFLAALPLYAIYDDHEVRNDWDGAFRAAESERAATGLAVWDEWFPLRTPADERWRSWRWGTLAELFMLDCRRWRMANADPDLAGKSMLGEKQRSWLLDGLARSTAPFKLVFLSVPLYFGTTANDSWLGFTWERDLILDTLHASGIANVVFLAGDQHWFAAHELTYGVREFQFGPVTAGLRHPYPQEPGELFRHVDFNFGEVTVRGGSAPELEVRAIDPFGAEIYREVIPAVGLP